MITVENISKKFGNVTALNDISFEIAKGEVVGLLGPNGAGKTTTMRIVTGYLDKDSGSVSVGGEQVCPENLKTKDLIGYLPENSPLYYDMEVVEFLDYIARLRSIPKGDRKGRIEEMVTTCGLSDVVGRQIGKLSKGFKQRVGLAQALVHRPEVLILDEPTSGLDPNQIVEIRNLIREIGKKRTVILSTHIMQEVEATCSRAIIINAGKIVGFGTIDELLRHRGEASRYTVSIVAERAKIEEALGSLVGLSLSKWLSSTGRSERVSLKGTDTKDRSEEIFKWAVAKGFVLSELSRDTASLEDVFKDLTVG